MQRYWYLYLLEGTCEEVRMQVLVKNRDYGIEVLRCLLMLGICIIHAAAYSKDRCRQEIL